MRSVIIALGAILVLSAPAQAFDGHRRGFILGGGIGLAGITFRQDVANLPWRPDLIDDHGTNGAVLTNFKIGFGASENVLIYFFNHTAWFSNENYFENSPDERTTVARSVGGIGFTYLLSQTVPSFGIIGGLGYSTWATGFSVDSDTWGGPGIWVGGCYEFKRHVMMEAAVAYGRASNDRDFEPGSLFEALTVGVSIDFMAY